MIELYTWNTSNGRKISIALEEMRIPYTVHAIDIYAGDQFSDAFNAITPNNKIPAIRDTETGQTLFESGAILLYLAEISGQFLASDPAKRWETIQWVMWQMGGFGPILGQAAHFLHYNAGASDYSANRFLTETRRLYAVLDGQLAGREFIVGEYSIADIAVWPWVSRFEHQKIDLEEFPCVLDWYVRVAGRSAVQKGYGVPDVTERPAMPHPNP
ncbi:glutathione S-transferase N-terminal domain-containing protein [Altererythrobacter arenosus]|uniref:Glutathione S-transferase N-terminal domain-containing protein n=1 Tax=Altererythrobacter arenosus TaxID=3032592 RepID=A0ABY8FRS9_9SPHN|nr:glutathione S-transferase N-terminal domain-containing protein [Altererythrobacter sp. CAU 1644]WFL77723.1 glutathione S-transferase N-terminal domain-containing protein [Altererythrobacter sp. CAU 1644]